jgi:hypothetical protein
MAALILALTAGGVGGYWLKSLSLSTPATTTSPPFVNSSRHAALERAESDLPAKLTLSMIRHATQEREESGQ